MRRLHRIWLLAIVGWLGAGTAEAEPSPAPKVNLAALVKNPAAFEKHLAHCATQGYGGANQGLMAAIGKVERVEALPGRRVTELVHVIGKKARAYVQLFDEGTCHAVPVTGKPAGFARGNFGRGAKNAYVLHPPDCGPSYCPTAVSLKTEDDKLVDVVFLPDECQSAVDVDRIALFGTHDSLKLGCWGSAGADPHRTDYLLDAGDRPLAIVFENFAGVAWVQTPEGDAPTRMCAARPPGEILVTTTGASPVLTASRRPEEAEYDALKEKSKVEWHAGGCDATVIWLRYGYDAKQRKFVPSGPGRLAIVGKLCTYRKVP
jgi:hypothetical protein